MLSGGVLCFAWCCLVLWPWLSCFFVVIVDVLWVLYLQWHQLPSWVSLLYLPHPCHLSLFLLIRGHHKKEAEGSCKLKKRRPHSTFLPILCLLLSHLAHSNEDPNDQERWTLKILHNDRQKRMTAYAMFFFVSLLLVSSFFESRDEIPFKGGRFVTPWNFQFQDVNREND
jgi:hypothetical protein